MAEPITGYTARHLWPRNIEHRWSMAKSITGHTAKHFWHRSDIEHRRWSYVKNRLHTIQRRGPTNFGQYTNTRRNKLLKRRSGQPTFPLANDVGIRFKPNNEWHFTINRNRLAKPPGRTNQNHGDKQISTLHKHGVPSNKPPTGSDTKGPGTNQIPPPH